MVSFLFAWVIPVVPPVSTTTLLPCSLFKITLLPLPLLLLLKIINNNSSPRNDPNNND
ncbi:hypothetical protein L195_g054363 [Trifolium pratense]|uniref:Uncharacterized protein n=1 Tax=Trifolium pratense TaxID=57577 RepID=A0A2K3KFQ9_TRIPR|nr:hypothetical protein L195_g054363 [Trifolium pratense]